MKEGDIMTEIIITDEMKNLIDLWYYYPLETSECYKVQVEFEEKFGYDLWELHTKGIIKPE